MQGVHGLFKLTLEEREQAPTFKPRSSNPKAQVLFR